MSECTPSRPCRRDDCVHCITESYLDAWDDGGRYLDEGAPDRTSRTVSETDDGQRERRLERIRSLTYRRSQLDLITPPGWLIEGMINRASLTLLSGKFGTYKSFVSVALACSVATGVPFLGMPVVEPGPVIYVAAEGASGILARVRAWERAHLGGQRLADDMFAVIGGPARILNADDMEGVDLLAKDMRPKMIIWDTLHRCAPGADENDSLEAGLAIDALAQLRESHDCTHLVNHHTGHSGLRARGSSAWEDDADGSWVIRLGGDGEDRSATNQRTMEHRKIKDGELADAIPIGLVVADDGTAYVDRMTVEPPADQIKGWLVVKAYAQRLDEAGVPLYYGRVRVIAALKELGVINALDNNMAADIARLRKAPGYRPYEPSVDARLPS